MKRPVNANKQVDEDVQLARPHYWKRLSEWEIYYAYTTEEEGEEED